MVFRMFAAALAAGLLSAVLITGLQSFITAPLILEAETFEEVAPAHNHDGHSHGDATAQPSWAPWAPEDGLERQLYTLLANCGAGIGFALLLVVGLSFDLPALSARRGVMWGVAGFSVFTLAPALGLPPGAPGMPTPDEQAAQIWWLLTVLLSGAGLGSMAFGKSFVIKALGAVLMVLPHLWGAPPLNAIDSQLPPELAARFAASSIVLSAVFWVMMGYLSGLFFSKLGERSAPD
ncbi:MAG: CbtA family protein [Rhodospirillales bacterium]|nr:CbtA family protein [Rhodospirillales bacterium]